MKYVSEYETRISMQYYKMPLIENPEVLTIPQIEKRLLKKIPELSSPEALRQALEKNGASLDKAASVLADVMNNSSEDKIRLRAALDVIKFHTGMEDDHATTSIKFVINGNINIANVLTPREMNESR